MNKIIVDISQLSLKKYTGISYYLFSLLNNVDIDKINSFILLSPFKAIPQQLLNSYKTEFWGIGKDAKKINWFVTLKRNYLGYYFLHKKVNKMNPDIFWGPDFVVPKNLNKSIKTFVHIHDMIIFNDELKEKRLDFAKKILGSIFLSQVKYSILNSDVVLTVSNSVANRINSFFHDRSLKIEVIYPAVDKMIFRYIEDPSKTLLKYSINTSFIMGINMKAERKNFVKLVDAFDKVKVKGLLCIVGNLSPYQIEYGSKVLKSRFKYLGYVPENDLPSIYSGANAVVLPSVEEGFDLPSIEARACFAPVIASDIDIHREVLEDEADYFKLDDEITLIKLINERLLNPKEVLKSKIIDKYSWQKSAEKLINLFET
ncbi:MAG: glycosyltransferase family 1 protein [Conexivisphaerales archaeon]